MPITENQKEFKRNSQLQRTIANKLNDAGVKVQEGKKRPKNHEYSGVISNSKKKLNLKL